MRVKGQSKFNLHGQRLCSSKVLFFVSLLFVMLVFSCLVSMFSAVSPFVLGASNTVVSNEAELTAAVNNAPSGVSVVIAFDRDIIIVTPLEILKGKDIRLVSEPETANFGIVGSFDSATISVGDGGVLSIDGISVTHENGYAGCGVYVGIGGTLRMYSGKISDNQFSTAKGGNGGGVYNDGTFVMSGGIITNNTARYYGGGVANWGDSFVMSGGEISGNTVSDRGGGVYHGKGEFTMSGGEISNNWADFSGGGVHSRVDTFTMSGGVISGNTANNWGGGVFNQDGEFTMSGGEISGNTAKSGGGVLNTGNFTMLGGKISKNTVHGPSSFVGGEGFGGGVSNWEGTFELRGGKISGNKASNGGGDVYYLGDAYYFGVKDSELIICVGVVFVVLGVVVAIMLFMSKKKRRAHVTEKLSNSI
jgi:Na+-transporting methylmalonyl-CoA/oxaloacetate decarboxylase gamma subunit